MTANRNDAELGWAWDFSLWVRWVLAPSITAILSFFIAGALVAADTEARRFESYVDRPNFMTGDNALGAALLWMVMLIVVVGPSTTLSQALVLRSATKQVNRRLWVLVSSLAFGISVLLFWFQYVGWFLPGVIIGFAQWLLLSKHFERAAGWILITIGAEVAAVVVGFLTRLVLPNNWIGFPSYPFYPLNSVMYWTSIWAVSVVVFSALTGLGLLWILRQEAAPLFGAV